MTDTTTKTGSETRSRYVRMSLWWLPGVVFIAILALGLPMSFTNPVWRDLPSGSVLDGAAAAQFETVYNEGLAIRPAAVTLWGVLDYALFRQGRPSVLVGSDGWLFTREEFEGTPFETAHVERDASEVISVRDALVERDIDLVVALLPTKAQVYPERLGRYDVPDYVETRYELMLSSLREAGVLTVDGLSALLGAKEAEKVFMRTDTHWTPAGAQAVAAHVARVARVADAAPAPERSYETSRLEPRSHEGDLLRFLPLGPFDSVLGVRPDYFAPSETSTTTGDEDGAGLFGPVSIPVAAVGTSYTADAAWNFVGALQVAFGTDVLDLADEGLGPFEPMHAALTGDELEDAGVTTVVWELPIRYVASRVVANEARR